jgi:hypothetical protein
MFFSSSFLRLYIGVANFEYKLIWIVDTSLVKDSNRESNVRNWLKEILRHMLQAGWPDEFVKKLPKVCPNPFLSNFYRDEK